MPMLSAEREMLIDAFERHVNAETGKDLVATLATMSSDPHIHNIPTVTGGMGFEAVKNFYGSLVPTGKFFPPDTEITPVSRTVDEHQLVDEIIFRFTHTTEIGWMLPGVSPTGKRVEVPLVVIVGFTDGKVSHEHIYWDQASVLVQVGLLHPGGLPVMGVETARKMDEIRSIRAEPE